MARYESVRTRSRKKHPRPGADLSILMGVVPRPAWVENQVTMADRYLNEDLAQVEEPESQWKVAPVQIAGALEDFSVGNFHLKDGSACPRLGL